MAVGSVVKTVMSSGLLGDAMNVAAFSSDYKSARGQGNSKAVSLMKGAASFAWGEMFFSALGGPGTIAYMGLTVGGQLAKATSEHTSQTMGQAYASNGQFGSGYFNMSDAGYTMRQRSLNAIKSNGLNTRSALGNEARTYFRG